MVIDQAVRVKRNVEKTGRCAKEEVSSSLLGKPALPFLCYKHIPNMFLKSSTHFVNGCCRQYYYSASGVS